MTDKMQSSYGRKNSGKKSPPVKYHNRFSVLENSDNEENEDIGIIKTVKIEDIIQNSDKIYKTTKKYQLQDTKNDANTIKQEWENKPDKKTNTENFLDLWPRCNKNCFKSHFPNRKFCRWTLESRQIKKNREKTKEKNYLRKKNI